MTEQQLKVLYTKKFYKFLRDEISASIAYIRLSNITEKYHVANELKEHADKEYEHFTQLMKFAYAHGFGDDLIVVLDEPVVNFIPADLNDLLKFVQHLEQTAIDDYKEMIKISKEAGSIEGCDFFRELLHDEMEHFDDLAIYLKQTRNLI